MDKKTNPQTKYFQDALSDFVYDAASGRAIRHLTDSGYTAAQIMQQLNYPTPFHKIQHTITRHLKETGILLNELPVPPSSFQPVHLNQISFEQLFSLLSQYISTNGEENSYVSCPFETASNALSMLTSRELEYLNGILWGPEAMYHRLNRRMLEISVQAALSSEEIRFYFFRSREVIIPLNPLEN